jgi:hypothetical protein
MAFVSLLETLNTTGKSIFLMAITAGQNFNSLQNNQNKTISKDRQYV